MDLTDAKRSAELLSLIGHREAIQANESLESAHLRFSQGSYDFLAVLDGRQVLGICARREVGILLGARYGFALYAKDLVRAHLSAGTILARSDQPLTELLSQVAGRRDEHFYDDVLLLDASGELAGMIYIRDLMRVQTSLLLTNISDLERSRAEIAAKKQQMDDDLNLATEVQLALLPLSLPPCQGAEGRSISFASHYEPAGGVGGDFYDQIPLGDGLTGILICDVMGHGVRSALVTAMVRTLVEELRPKANEPALFLTLLNTQLSKLLQRTGEMIFVTAAYGLFDANSGKLRYAQAGHPPPLLARLGEELPALLPGHEQAGGPALGLMEDHVYAEIQQSLRPGDRILFYTDGLTEAADAEGLEYGCSRLAQSIKGAQQLALAELPARLLAEALRFTGELPLRDDVCLVASEFQSPA